MLRRIGLFSALARASASCDQGYQSTGLFACCSRYGLVSPARRLAIVISSDERQFFGHRTTFPLANYIPLARSKSKSAKPAADHPSPVSRRPSIPWLAIGISLAV